VNRVTAIILGGGRGSRLFPLTGVRSKPAVGFGGKYRLIDIPISNCINSDVRRIYVLTQFLSASLHRHIMQTYTFDVFTDGFVDILAAEQTAASADWFQGTSDAVRATLNHTMYYDSDQMLILSGDHLYRMDYRDLIAFHRETDADVTICVHPVTREQAPRLGLMRADRTGVVSEFVEKPQEPAVIERFAAPPELFAARGLDLREGFYLASMGNYVFQPEVLRDLLADTDKTDFGKEVIPAALESCKVMAYPFDEYWADIGTISSLYRASLALTQPDPPFDFYDPNHPIYTRSRFLPPSREDGCRLERAVVAEGCKLYDADIEECVIGLRSMIRPGARLRQVVMMGADFYEDEGEKAENRRLGRPHVGIGENASVERAIIDKNVRVGQEVVIRSHEGEPDREEEHYVIRDGIVVIPEDTVIPDGTTI
jgi:glucose-1-phosphate adenylyltransferase